MQAYWYIKLFDFAIQAKKCIQQASIDLQSNEVGSLNSQIYSQTPAGSPTH